MTTRAARGIMAALGVTFVLLGANAVYRAGPRAATATRPAREARSDLPVYLAASAEALAGKDPFGATGPRGWPYHYPPTLAVLLAPMVALPVQVAAALWYALGVAGLVAGVWATRRAIREERERAPSLPSPSQSRGGGDRESGPSSGREEETALELDRGASPALRAEPSAPSPGSAGEGGGGGPPWDRWDGLALALIAVPATSGLLRGQLGPVLLGVFGLGLLALARGRDVAGGTWWALAAALKITPGLPLVALLVARRWRALGAACVASVALLVLLPAPLIGVECALRSCGEVARVVVLGSASGEAALDLPGDDEARRFDPHIATNQALGSQVVRRAPESLRTPLLALLIVAGLVATVPLAARGARPSCESAALLLALPLVVSTVAWHHHHVLLYPALALLCARARAGAGSARVALALFTAAQVVHFGGAELEHLAHRIAGEARAPSVIQGLAPLGWGTLVVVATLARDAWRISATSRGA